MPIGFSSPARNLFLLGSSGAQVVTNFFKTIDQSAGTDGVYLPDEIKYNEVDQKFVLAGSAEDSNSKGFGWFEKRDETGTADFENRIEATQTGVNTTLLAMELDVNDKLIVGGKTGDVPWIAKYSNGGVIEWQSTTNTANLEYTGITSDSNGQYYACGSQYPGSGAVAFVEKFDANGNPGWGKAGFMLGREVLLNAIAANSRGEVVAVGQIEDDNSYKGYIVKIDTNTGEVLWDRTLTQHLTAYGYVVCRDVYIDSKDQIYIVGARSGGNPSEPTEGFLIKYSPEGNIIWQKASYTPNGTLTNYAVKSDGETEQTIVFGTYYDQINNDLGGVLSKYSKNGDLVWRRTIYSSYNNSDVFGSLALDADPSFYYLLYVDDNYNALNGTPEAYTFGKVSSSGNGLGNFQYAEGTGETIDYEILNVQDKIGRLSDGSVRQDTSDLITYPFNGTKVLFDDLATQVSNKKRQMDSADSFEYSGSPAIRPADFQELNLLGDVYSGSDDWLDQSGKGNNGTTSYEITTTTGSTTESENFASVTSSYSSYGTVAENTVTNDLPFTATHYSGKVRDLQSGGFRVDLTGNTTGSDFFMGMWVKFDSTPTASQMGINLFGNYKYCEVRSVGVIRIRYNGGTQAESGATNVADGNWHHLAFSQTGGRIYGLVDGISVVSTTNGVGTSTVQANENFWFFGGSGTAYNIDAKVLDPFVYVGAGTSGYTVPTAPLIDSNGNINHFSGFSGLEEYISPGISVPGGTVTTTNTVAHNAGGWFEFDGVDDKVSIDPILPAGTTQYTIEAWFRHTGANAIGGPQVIWEQNGDVQTTSRRACMLLTSHTGVLGFNGQSNDFHSGPSAASIVNTWHHSVITVDTSDGTNPIKIYANGSLFAQGQTSGPGAPASNLNVAATKCGMGDKLNGSEAEEFKGDIGEVRIYPRVLTAAQVFQNYNATKSKYIEEAPDVAPKITSDGIVIDSNLVLNYDFGNRATFDSTSNEFKFSDDLTNSNWATLNSVIVQEYNGRPKGFETNATAIIRSTTAEAQLIRQNFTTPSGVPVNISCYAKSIAGGNLCINYNSGTVLFDFSTETGTAIAQYDYNGTDTSPIPSSITMEDVGDGWYRCSFTGYTNGVVAQCQFQPWTQAMSVIDATTWDDRYDAGDGAQGVAIIGTQFAEGVTTPQRYFKTAGTSITAPTTVKNLSSNSYPNTINGATFDSAGYFDFDGTNDNIFSGSPETIVYSGGTFEAWLYFDDVSNNRGFMSHSAGGAGPYINFYSPGASQQKMRWEVIANTGNAYTTILSNTNLVTGQWYHFVGTFDGASTITLYVNGTLDIQNPNMSNQPTTVTAAIELAEYAGYMDGRIGETRIYNRALTATEVSQNFNATRAKYGV